MAEKLFSSKTLQRLSLWINREMYVLQIFGHTFRVFRFDLFSCGIQRIVGFPAFRRATHVRSRMREGNSRFGQTNKFHRLLRRERERQGFWIGKTDILARKNHDAPRDESE